MAPSETPVVLQPVGEGELRDDRERAEVGHGVGGQVEQQGGQREVGAGGDRRPSSMSLAPAGRWTALGAYTAGAASLALGIAGGLVLPFGAWSLLP